ncbi:alpha-2-macroglobulin family protein [Fodinibius salinus]|uniref:alpha-2-macroglobulin family protein n=1 Tax=Fodinibius salinus TaxID=860790 RepID=UPI0011E70BF9|nr:alpha-2-macroglobulin family protein [Fodinibius salinus]
MSKVPGRLSANLLTRVFENSGNFSVNRSSIPYYPYKTLVGLQMPEGNNRWDMLARDSTHTIDIVTLDADGDPMSRKNVEVEIFKIDWRWWWEKSNRNLSQYFTEHDLKPLFSEKTQTGAKGKAQVDFRIDEYDWGRFMVRVTDLNGGHAAGQTFYLGWSYFRNNQSGNPARLAFESDQEEYQVGEEVTLNIPSSAGGKALVSLESGSRILQNFWVDTKQKQTKVSFLASEAMAPNIYAHVMLIQPHGQRQNDRPIRMYGVIPISVEDPATKIEPIVDLPSELRPETTANINVSEKNGRPMTYTVAVVDEGLLDLTNFKTPNPHRHFYAREALGVKTWDLFNFVASSYAGNMNRILSIGGDQDTQKPKQGAELNRFKPMVEFLGPFNLKAGKTNQHSINIPNYVGSVRTMVVAAQDGAYGHTEKATPVRKPVMVLGTLPRVLGPNEQVTLPVSVFAMNDDIEEVNVQIKANELFEIDGSSSQTVSFDEPGEKTVRFDLQVSSRIGAGKVQIDAHSGGEAAHHDINIKVRTPNPPVTNIHEQVLDPGEEWDFEYSPVGVAGTNTGIFEVSRIPPINLGQRLSYLIRYPHGCIEQVVSSVFPQLYLHHIVDLSDARKQKIQKNIDAAIQRLRSFQIPSGGVGYWPDHNSANEWGTNYAYHFLLEAKNMGYYVPKDLLNNIKRFQRQRASNWRFVSERDHNDDLIQAYRLYTLALANTPDLGAMNRLREHKELSVQGGWRLAAAYKLAGQTEAADDLVRGAKMNISKYDNKGRTYGSEVRDQAMILETLSIMDKREKAAPLMKEIAGALNKQRWMSTQTTAYSLIGIARFLKIAKGTEEIDLQYNISGAGRGSVQSTAPVSQVPFDIEGNRKQQVQATNNSEGVVFARLIQQGTPAAGKTTAASNNLVQKVKYLNLDGEELNPARLPQGTDIIAEVTVRNPGTRGNHKNLALTQIFPSGWEIRNTRMDKTTFKKPTSEPDYQDIRDDRVYTYFDLPAGKSKTFRTMLNISYTGKYYLPTVSTSAMYDETVSARTPGQWVKVVLPE